MTPPKQARFSSGMPPTRITLWLAGVLFLCFVYFLPRWLDWNQDARVDMTAAIVNHRTIAIDAYQANTGDDAFYRGHYYSNKAPGQSLLGIPVYGAQKAFTSFPPGRNLVNAVEKNSGWSLALRESSVRFLLSPKLDFALFQYLASIFTVAVPSVLFLLVFFWFLGFFSESVANRLILTLGLGLATIFFPYSQVFYSHVPAAALLFVAFVLLYLLANQDHAKGKRSDWIHDRSTLASAVAGLCLGAAVVFEYPAAIISLLIGLYGLTHLPRRLSGYLVLGSIPGLLTVMGFNYAAYHNPIVTGYSGHSVVWKQESQGIGGFSWPPRLNAIWGMSFSPYRGLFFLSPFLLLSVPGFWMWFRRGGHARLLCLAIPPIFFFTVAMYWGWYAGWAVGPRYLIPMLPFLTLPIIFVLDYLKSWGARAAVYGLLILSLLNVWIQTLGGLEFPPTKSLNPLFSDSLPALSRGEIPLNLGTFVLYPAFGTRAALSIVPLFLLLGVWSLLVLVPLRSPFGMRRWRAAGTADVLQKSIEKT
jgi:hypothetical protein